MLIIYLKLSDFNLVDLKYIQKINGKLFKL